MRPILVADLFCGAGGSSTGAKKAVEQLDRRMVLTCVNHWDRAIETHQRMHPEARHYCMDVASARPIELVPEGWLDLLMASPTCTFHSRARGGRPTSDQQRMDPWHLITWCTELSVRRLLVENVPEFVDWGPVDPRTGRPIKSKKGQYFREWISTLERLGYRVEWKILNCADYGDATTRRRFFLLGRKRGKIRWPEPTHAREPGHDLLAPRQRWRSARDCLDFSLRGASIYGRKYDLSIKTMLRIYSGITRFKWPVRYEARLRAELLRRGVSLPAIEALSEGRNPEPFMLGQHFRREVLPSDAPVPSPTTVSRIGLIEPFLCGNRTNNIPKPVDGPAPTFTTTTGGGIFMVAPAFMLAQAQGGVAREATEPMPAIPCGGAHALIAPYYGKGSGLTAKSADQPLDTIPTHDRFGLIMPATHGGGFDRVHGLEAPVPGITCAPRGELAFITSAFGERDGQMPRVHDIAQPVPAILAQGRTPLVEPEESDDILYRMLHWRELARAMSFSDDESDYEFAGTKTEITRQIGNAVPVRMATALVSASLWDMDAA